MKALNERPEGVVLFIIDPQNDFMGMPDGTPYYEAPRGGITSVSIAALPVRGATDAMDLLSAYVDADANGEGIDDIVVTLDTHEENAGNDPNKNPDIGHSAYWRDKAGNEPDPMKTVITLADVENGTWLPYNPLFMEQVREYLRKVGVQVVWNRHCIDSTWGHRVYGPLADALKHWEERSGKSVLYVRKGMNTGTEQYGAFEAAKPDPKDPRTSFNWFMLDRLNNNPRRKMVAGIATDYCVKTSMEQAVAKLSCGDARKYTLFIDAMAAVNLDGTDKVARDFVSDMIRKGVSVTNREQALA